MPRTATASARIGARAFGRLDQPLRQIGQRGLVEQVARLALDESVDSVRMVKGSQTKSMVAEAVPGYANDDLHQMCERIS